MTLIRNLGLHWLYAFYLALCDVRVRQSDIGQLTEDLRNLL